MGPTQIPGVEYYAPPRAQSRTDDLAWPPKIIVIHDTGNPSSTRYNEASYASTRTDDSKNWTSSHAYIDEGGVLGSLRLNFQAWAAYSYANRNGIHLEMCLRGNRAATRKITATLVGRLCDMTGIPRVKLSPAEVAAGHRGICGHRDITLGLKVGNHTDPGADFPWNEFMTNVGGAVSAPTAEGDDVQLTEKLVQPLFADYDPATDDDPNTSVTVGQSLAFTQQNAHYARLFAKQALEIARQNQQAIKEIKSLLAAGTPVPSEPQEGGPLDLSGTYKIERVGE